MQGLFAVLSSDPKVRGSEVKVSNRESLRFLIDERFRIIFSTIGFP